MFASEAASLVVNFKKHFVERRLAESMLAPVVPTAAFRDAETGLIARFVSAAIPFLPFCLTCVHAPPHESG